MHDAMSEQAFAPSVCPLSTGLLLQVTGSHLTLVACHSALAPCRAALALVVRLIGLNSQS